MVGAEVFVALAPTLISNLADIYADEEDVTEQKLMEEIMNLKNKMAKLQDITISEVSVD